MGNTQNIRAWLAEIAEIAGDASFKFSHRIDIKDGGYNSYVSLIVDITDTKFHTEGIKEVQLFRHTNTVALKCEEWKFSLGNICDPYNENPDIAMFFGSYGKTLEVAANEATKHLNGLKREFKKQVRTKQNESEKSKKGRIAELRQELERLEG